MWVLTSCPLTSSGVVDDEVDDVADGVGKADVSGGGGSADGRGRPHRGAAPARGPRPGPPVTKTVWPQVIAVVLKQRHM